MATRWLIIGDLWRDGEINIPDFYGVEFSLNNDPASAKLDLINPARRVEKLPRYRRDRMPDKLLAKQIMKMMTGFVHDDDTVGGFVLPGWQSSRGVTACYMLMRFYDKGLIGAFPRSDGSFWISELEGVHHPFEEGISTT